MFRNIAINCTVCTIKTIIILIIIIIYLMMFILWYSYTIINKEIAIIIEN